MSEVLTDRVTRIEAVLRSELGYGTQKPGTITAWQTHYAKRLQRLEHTVDGNGQLGLKTKLLIVWHTYVWAIGLIGALFGGLLVKLIGL